MRIATTLSDASDADAQTVSRAPLDRRTLVRGVAATGALALLAPLAGCAALGIEDPTVNQEAADEPKDVPGTVDFDKLYVQLDLDQATWSWSKIDNDASQYNGSLVVGIPMTATNNDEMSRVLSGLYCKAVTPSGTTLPDISAYYTSDDILQGGSIAPGSTSSGLIHIVYDGPGTYKLAFDNLLGRKAELSFAVGSSSASGMRPIPARTLSSADAANAVPYGESFDVSGLTMTLTSDESTYWWTQSWDEYNEVWNGRWCVGVPLTITNNSSAPVSFNADMYGLFAPGLYRLEDPAPWFSGSAAAYVGTLNPGQTVQVSLFWPYDTDGWYYAVFDDNGRKAVASAQIINYP